MKSEECVAAHFATYLPTCAQCSAGRMPPGGSLPAFGGLDGSEPGGDFLGGDFPVVGDFEPLGDFPGEDGFDPGGDFFVLSSAISCAK